MASDARRAETGYDRERPNPEQPGMVYGDGVDIRVGPAGLNGPLAPRIALA